MDSNFHTMTFVSVAKVEISVETGLKPNFGRNFVASLKSALEIFFGITYKCSSVNKQH